MSRRRLSALAFVMLLGACAGPNEHARSGQALLDQGRTEEGLAELEKAVRAEPGNAELRMQLIRQRENQVTALVLQAEAARAAGRLDEAESQLKRADEIAPNHPRVRGARDSLQLAQREQLRRAAAAAAPTATAPPAPVLGAALRKPVTLDFRDANLKAVFEALSRTTGINFVFDREVRPDIKVTLSIANTSIDDVVSVLAVSNQLERKTLNENTVLIYPNTTAKQKDYSELMVKTFFLGNADVKSVQSMLKTVLRTRDLYADEKLNSLTMRDTPAAVRLAEKLIAAQDLPEPEVVLDVEVLEIKRSRFTEIGIEPPGTLTVLNIVPNPTTVISTATGQTAVVDNTLTSTQLTLDRLRGLRGSQIGIANTTASLRAENGDANILANPSIRVRTREKARILIGDRVPVITTISTANVGVSESVSYLEVGLKLDVEANVFLDNEVGIKLGLEVSNIVKEVKSRTGSLTYQIGTRLANTTLRVKNGETQALAGLISDEDRRSAVGMPGMVDLPVLGRLLSTETKDRTKTEIVLLITPRIVRNLPAAALAQYEYPSGTESAVGAAALRVRSGGRMALQPSAGAGTRAPLEPAAAPAAAEPASAASAPAE